MGLGLSARDSSYPTVHKKENYFFWHRLGWCFFSFSFTFAAVHHAEHTTKAKEKFVVGEKTVLLQDGSWRSPTAAAAAPVISQNEYILFFLLSLSLSLSRDRERFDGVCLRRKSVNEKYYTARAHRYSVSILRAECIRLDFVIHEEFDVRKAHSHSRCKLGAAAARNMKKEFINENARHARKYSILATLKKVTELSWIQHGYGGLCHAHPSSGVCILSQSRHSISLYGHGIHKNESLNEVSVDGKFHTTTKSYNIP